jgi:ABC-type transport system involved in cytochrome bd biosynthesis fused ATPase/permease subunit
MDLFVRRTRALTLWLLAFCSIVGAVAVVSLLFSAGQMVTASDAELVLLLLLMVLPMATVAAVRNDRKTLA